MEKSGAKSTLRFGGIIFGLDPAIYAFNARFYEHIRPGVCCPVLFGGVPFVNRGHERDRVHFACGSRSVKPIHVHDTLKYCRGARTCANRHAVSCFGPLANRER